VTGIDYGRTKLSDDGGLGVVGTAVGDEFSKEAVMEVLVLGTGSAGGVPNPWCDCTTCAAARAAGEVRGRTAALLDDVLLLDCGEAHGASRSLADVRAVLLTATADPAALRWRWWAGRRTPLTVAGPAATLEASLRWISPDDPVRLRSVAVGEVLDLNGHVVRVLAAGNGASGSAIRYDITALDGARLLYAPDIGSPSAPDPASPAGAAYDVVLLGEGGIGPESLDATTFPRQLAALRASGAVLPTTDVIAVHLSHRSPPTCELTRRLAPWGARVVPDGTVLHVQRGTADRAAGVAAPREVRRLLVLGGARSGKSAEAERQLAAEPHATYVATGDARADDPEWVARVAAHRDRRPARWTTVETTDLVTVLDRADGPVLVDCLGMWLAAVLDECGVWTGGDLAAAHARVDALVAAWRQTRARVVAVSSEVGAGVVPATASGRLYRDELGRLNARLADESDVVLLVVAGQVLTLRGTP
jgi:adenosylcobinamide kinase/adenosylcobinamide-phosphate guanylyltransferase